MRFSSVGLGSSVLACAFAGLAQAQAVALPLRGEGEFVVQDRVKDVQQGSVLLQADSTVKVVFIDSGTPRTLLAGVWRMADRSTAEMEVHEVLGSDIVRGAGEIHFRPDGSVGRLSARGLADGREFTFHFDNGMSLAAAGLKSTPADSAPYATGAVPQRQPGPQTGDDSFPWGGDWAVVDATRHGEGLLTEAGNPEVRLDRARLTLGDNDEFLLVVDGDSRAEFAGTWEGNPQDSPVRLYLREAMGKKLGGVGRVWLRDRSWDRDWSFRRVELDGWDDGHGDNAFTLYFEAERP